MQEERRERQSLNLNTGTRKTHRSLKCGDREEQQCFLPNRWFRIGLRALKKDSVFNNIHTHINVDSLREAFMAIDGSKATGVDGVTKKDFGMNLEQNLKDLTTKVQNGSYRPLPKRIVYIPKSNGSTRPIAISCFKDKLVDWVVGKILSSIYEPHFIRNSFGYRPGKSAEGAIKACYYSVFKNRRKYALEIDFSNFFNTISHQKLMNILKKRITDTRFKRLIGRFLKSDVLTDEGDSLPSEVGTPQGSIMSPVLANIFLDEVIDQWFKENYGSYNNIIVRYADDGIFFFKEEKSCRQFKVELEKRIKGFGLSFNKDKTRIINLSRDLNNEFNFLGITFYWGKQGRRRLLKIKTSKDKLHRSINEFDHWIKRNRNKAKLSVLWEMAKLKVRGHVNYFGYHFNKLKLNHFIHQVKKSLFKWLNRRSQKRSYNWEGFNERLKYFPLLEDFENLKLKQLGWNPYATK